MRSDQAMEKLHEACSDVPFASGCSVHRACHAVETEMDFCHPVNGLLAVCLEYGDLDVCAEFEEICGSLEDLEACEGVMALELPSTLNAYEAVREICNDHGMQGCDQCRQTSANPNRNGQRTRFMNACMDPLGSWSSLCMEMDMIACDGWKEWCGLETTMSLSGLCEDTSTHEHYHDAHEHHHHDHEDHVATQEVDTREHAGHDHASHEDNSMSEDHSTHDHSMHGRTCASLIWTSVD